MNFCRLTIQEPIFSVSNTEFEGGDDGHGHGDRIFFWSNKPNPAMQLTENMDIKPKILHFGVGMPD